LKQLLSGADFQQRGEPASSTTMCQKLALDFRDLAVSFHPEIAELLDLTSGRD